MTSIRLVVCDVDGTLVDKKKRLTQGNVEAIARLSAAGVDFTIISARSRSGMMPIADALGLDREMAAFNGGMIFRRDGSTSFHETIDPKVARGVIDLAKDAPVDTWVFADDLWHANAPDGPHTASERITSNQEPTATADFSPLLDRADKITFVSDDEAELRRLAERAIAAFGGLATIAQSQTYYLDVTALPANKGAGLAALGRAFGAATDAIAAIGDQANDIAMLKRAGLSIVVAGAPDAVKAVAGHVTAANDADGVARAIDEIILPSLSSATGVPK